MSCGRVIDGICPGSSGGSAGLAENIDGGDIGDVVTQTDPDTTGFTSPGVAGTVLTSNGVLTLPTYQAVTDSTNTTNINGGNIGDIVYQTSANTTGFITPGAIGTILNSNGVLTAPSYITPSIPFTIPTVTKYTSGSGTFNAAVDCKYIIVYLQGGGGGGGGAYIDQCSGGGGGGAFACVRLAAGSYSYSVGTGGAGGPFNTDGSNGTASTFSTFTAGGGAGGSRQRSNAVNTAFGSTITGTTLTNALHFESGGNGGNVNYSSPDTNVLFGGYGGSSKFGGMTRSPSYNTGSFAGVVPGRGGSGSASSGAVTGGDGGPGIIIVVSYFQ